MRLSGEGFTRGLENLCTSKAGLLKKRRSRVLLAISAAAASGVGLFLSAHSAQAATDTWNGTSANWSVAGNWISTLPNTGDTINFSGSGITSTTDDLVSLTSIGALNFTGTSAYTIGNSLGTSTLGLTGALTDSVAGGATAITQTINISLAGTSTSALDVSGGATGGVGISFGSNETFGSFLDNTNATNADTVSIGSGNTLTVNGSFVVGIP